MDRVADRAWPEAQEAATARRAWTRWVAGAVALALLAGLAFWAVKSFKGGSAAPRSQTVKIAVLPDTPPPPPPKEEKKPEPEKREDKPQPRPEPPKPQAAPPAPQSLKMDGPAGDGPSSFGAGQITQEYQGGEAGTGAGGTGLQFAFYANQVTRHLQAALARNRDLKIGDYRVSVGVWLSPSGEFKRVELLTSSGDDKVDEALKRAFLQLPPMPDAPPNLPQPIRLRITNRMNG